MDAGAVYRPKCRERRYSALTEGTRKTYYLARRYLNYSIEEWEALPWWEQRVYIEGLEWELTPPEDESPNGGSPRGTGPASQALAGSQDKPVRPATRTDLEGLGLTIREG